MNDAQKLITDVLLSHISRYRSGHYECLEPDCDWQGATLDAHAEHLAAEIDKALGGLMPEYIARHESGGGTIHGTLVNAEIAMRSYVVFPPGVDEPGSGRLTGIETRWVSGWSEVQP